MSQVLTWNTAFLSDLADQIVCRLMGYLYTYNKRLLRQIDGRVRYLVKRVEDLQIVDYSPQQEGKVFFGAWVELENEAGDIVQYRIVGKDELDTKLGYITIDSPMARALIGKQVDDEVKVTTPSGAKEWYVNKIQYQAFKDERADSGE